MCPLRLPPPLTSIRQRRVVELGDPINRRLMMRSESINVETRSKVKLLAKFGWHTWSPDVREKQTKSTILLKNMIWTSSCNYAFPAQSFQFSHRPMSYCHKSCSKLHATLASFGPSPLSVSFSKILPHFGVTSSIWTALVVHHTPYCQQHRPSLPPPPTRPLSQSSTRSQAPRPNNHNHLVSYARTSSIFTAEWSSHSFEPA